MYLIFDTETTGLPRNFNAPITDTANWPRIVQIAWQLHDEFGNLIDHKDFLVRPDGHVARGPFPLSVDALQDALQGWLLPRVVPRKPQLRKENPPAPPPQRKKTNSSPQNPPGKVNVPSPEAERY